MNSNPKIRIGIDLGGTNIKYGCLDAAGNTVVYASEATLAHSGADNLLRQLGDIAEKLIRENENSHTIESLGVVTPGAVDITSGVIIGGSPNIPGWVGARIGQTLKERLNLPVLVENDARAMALAELRLGAGKGVSSAICLTIGTGIGGAVIMNGQLWRGSSQSAGEIGHMVVDIDGQLGDDGLPGSLESLAAAPAIVRRVRRALNENMTPVFRELLAGSTIDLLTARQVFEAYHREDVLAREAMNKTAQILGLGLVGIVNTFNPERVIIGGGVADAVGAIVPLIDDKIRSLALSSAVESLSVAPAQLGNKAGFIGAALLASEDAWKPLLTAK